MADTNFETLTRIQLETPVDHIGFAAQFLTMTDLQRRNRSLELLADALSSSESLTQTEVASLKVLMIAVRNDERLIPVVRSHLDQNMVNVALDHWKVVFAEFPNLASVFYQSIGDVQELDEEQLSRLLLADTATKSMVEEISESQQINGRSLEVLILLGGWNDLDKRYFAVRDALIEWYIGSRKSIDAGTLRCYLTAMFGRNDLLSEEPNEDEISQLRADVKYWFEATRVLSYETGWPLYRLSYPLGAVPSR